MSPYLTEFVRRLQHALRSLGPIVAVVLLFQVLVFRQVPEQPVQIALGLAVVAVGIAVFLQGLDLSVFPAGRSLANQFARRGALLPLLAFGFAIGFAAVVAEPALIAIADQAEEVSQGRVDGVALRLVVAVSVGAVVALGMLRILRGWNIRALLIGGYALVLAATWVAPPRPYPGAMTEVTTHLTLRPPHRTFLFWAVLVMVLTAVAVGAIGVLQDGWTAGTAVRAVFILGMVVFWVGAMRAGTTTDREGMTLCNGLTTRRLRWERVERLGTDQPGEDARRVTALVEGRAVVLPGVLVEELDRLEARRLARRG